MSPFDITWHYKFAGYYWNFGYLSKGKLEMKEWFRMWKFYIARPIKVNAD